MRDLSRVLAELKKQREKAKADLDRIDPGDCGSCRPGKSSWRPGEAGEPPCAVSSAYVSCGSEGRERSDEEVLGREIRAAKDLANLDPRGNVMPQIPRNCRRSPEARSTENWDTTRLTRRPMPMRTRNGSCA